MRAFEVETVLAESVRDGKRYQEFLRESTMSAGTYTLPAGSTDAQRAHAEDEAYFVVRGRARFTAGGREVAVGPGTILFVPAREPHCFHDILEELVVLVFFAPPESG